jgi:hypothetical protein
VLPAERRDLLEQGRIDGLGFPKQSDGAFQVKRVPQRDGGDHQVKTAGAILLIFEGTVADLAQPIEKYSLGEGVLASPLLRPAVTRRRKAGSCNQASVNSVRSILPISRRARARLFCRG